MNIWAHYYWSYQRFSLLITCLLPWVAAYLFANGYNNQSVKILGYIGPVTFGYMLNANLLQHRALEWAALVPNFKRTFMSQQLLSMLVYLLALMPAMLLWPSAELYNVLLLSAICALFSGFFQFTELGARGSSFLFMFIIFLGHNWLVPLPFLLWTTLIAFAFWCVALFGGWSVQATTLLRQTPDERTYSFINIEVSKWFTPISAPLKRWLHPLSYLFDDLLGWVVGFLLLPITFMALLLMSLQLEDMQSVVYLAAVVGIFICWTAAVAKDYRKALARLWLLPCYQGLRQLRQAYVKAQWRLLSLLVVIMLAFGLCQAVITPTLEWAEQLLHITLTMVNACMAVQLIGLKYCQDRRGLWWSAAVVVYLVGAAELGTYSIAIGTSVDLVILGLILLLRYQQLPQFWRNGLTFE